MNRLPLNFLILLGFLLFGCTGSGDSLLLQKNHRVPENNVEIETLLAQYDSIFDLKQYSNQEKFSLLSKAQRICVTNNCSLKLIEIHYRYGKFYFLKNGDKTNAIKSFYTCIELAEKSNSREYYLKSYNYLGIIYHDYKKYKKALSFFKKSIDTGAASTNESNNIPYYLSGLCYYRLHIFDSAEYYLKKAMALSAKAGPMDRVYECGYGLARVYLEKHKIAEAETLIYHSLNNYKLTKNFEGLSVGYFLLAKVEAMRHKTNKALDYAILSKNYVQKIKLIEIELEISQLISDLYLSKNDPKNAYKYLAEVQKLRDEMYDSDASIQIELSQAQQVSDKEKNVLNEEIERKEREREKAMVAMGIFGGLFLVIIGLLFFVRKERKKVDELLLNILPENTVKELKQYGKAIPKRHSFVTVMFCDVEAFSKKAENLSPEILIEILDFYFSHIDTILSKYEGIEKIKTIGDAYMCAAGLNVSIADSAIMMTEMAMEILTFLDSVKDATHQKFGQNFSFRIGIHSGGLVSGVVGSHKYAYDIWGDTVNIASRMESYGETGKINVSPATYERIKSKYPCTHRGKIEVKNGLFLDMYFVNLDSVPFV